MNRRPVLSGLRLTLLVAALACLSWTPLAVEDDPLVRMPGSQTTQQLQLPDAGQCKNCHGEYDQALEPWFLWRGSMMAQAARDPLYWACLTVAAQDSVWALGNPNATDLCLRCHFPAGWVAGRSDPTNGSDMSGPDFDGIYCYTCHVQYDPFFEDTYLGTREGSDWVDYWDETGKDIPSQDEADLTYAADVAETPHITLYNSDPFFVSNVPFDPAYDEAGGGQYFFDTQQVRRGPLADHVANHEVLYSRFHKSKYFCNACHDVSNPALANLAYAGTPPGDGKTVLPTEDTPAYAYFHVERTFSEFQLSDYGLQGGAPGSGDFAPGVLDTSLPGDAIARCQDCHFPDRVGKACDKQQAPVRPTGSVEHPMTGVASHEMTGGNAWITAILASTDSSSANYDQTNENLLNDSSNLTMDIGAGEGLDPDALLAGRDRALAMLEAAGSLQDVVYDAASGELTFKVVNHTGHKLISGFPEGRRMWVNIRAYQNKALIWEVNPYDAAASTLIGLTGYTYDDPTPPALPDPLPLGGNQAYLDELVYEAHTSSTLTGEDHTFHFVLADDRSKDNRIPPAGFRINEADDRLSEPVWGGVVEPGYFTSAEYAGGYDDVWVQLPMGADDVQVRLYYQTTSREYVEFLRDEINGVGGTLYDNPTPSGETDAYIIQTDPFFEFLRIWGDTIWDLWEHNRALPGAAPVLMDSTSGASAWYADVDGDGYGDPGDSVVSEIQPSGYVADGSDCDDADASVHPGAAEACDGLDTDCDGGPAPDEVDADGDGQMVCAGDCDDGDAAIYDGAPELCDALDNDCDGQVDEGVATDADGDGVSSCAGDCDDGEATVYPGAVELCDGLDNDCDGVTPPDEADGDGDGSPICGGDCDDTNPNVFPGAAEICNAMDDDCDGALPADEADADLDGIMACAGDCDDAAPAVHPGAVEVCNGVDDDCDAATDEALDGDGDGWSICDGDCLDDEATVYPGALELCDGLDTDCDPSTDEDVDADGDGYTTCFGDCDDTDDTVYDLAPELCDGLDNDCDGLVPADEDDGDGDGHRLCDNDCDDGDATTYPGAPEQCDKVDNDCDGTVDEDVGADGDKDGYNACQGDCDDSDATMNPGEIEGCDGKDNDCDGVLPADEADDDGDGWMACDGDCDDGDAALTPADADGDSWSTCDGDCDDGDAALTPADGDKDGYSTCQGDCDDGDAALTPVDGDLDGTSSCDGDCDDADPAVHPGMPELCNGVDDDCSGAPEGDEVDVDGDGWMICDGDCDDGAAGVFPGALEICNGVDDDCDAATDELADLDGDGFSLCTGDCDDGDDEIHPGAEEACNGVDDDCDPATDEAVDGDGDGVAVCDGDCDDGDGATHPAAVEQCDGVDNDCDGGLPANEVDGDGDGWMVCAGDCDDGDAGTWPGAPEQCDGLDNDCDGTVDEDVDTDGDGDGITACQGDCDDTNPAVHPGAKELCDGLDGDCDGSLPADEVDGDGDGFSPCAGDCDDGAPLVSPDAVEICFDGVDNDCDGDVDGDDLDCVGDDDTGDDDTGDDDTGDDDTGDDDTGDDDDDTGDDDDDTGDDDTGDDDGDDDDTGGDDCQCRTGGAAHPPWWIAAGLLALLVTRWGRR